MTDCVRFNFIRCCLTCKIGRGSRVDHLGQSFRIEVDAINARGVRLFLDDCGAFGMLAVLPRHPGAA